MIYKLYTTVKHNTDIKGYWQDKTGKIFIDNIVISKYSSKKAFKIAKKALFNSGELAVFYTYRKHGIIEDKQGTRTLLNKRLEYKFKTSFDNVKRIKDTIKQYNGCTVYEYKGHILIEVYTN